MKGWQVFIALLLTFGGIGFAFNTQLKVDNRIKVSNVINALDNEISGIGEDFYGFNVSSGFWKEHPFKKRDAQGNIEYCFYKKGARFNLEWERTDDLDNAEFILHIAEERKVLFSYKRNHFGDFKQWEKEIQSLDEIIDLPSDKNEFPYAFFSSF